MADFATARGPLSCVSHTPRKASTSKGGHGQWPSSGPASCSHAATSIQRRRDIAGLTRESPAECRAFASVGSVLAGCDGRPLRGAELRGGDRAGEAARELELEVGVVAVGEAGLVVAEDVADEDLDELGVELGAGDPAQLRDRG